MALYWNGGKRSYTFIEDKDVSIEFINGGDIIYNWFGEQCYIDTDKIDYIEVTMPTLFKKGDFTFYDNTTDDIMDVVVDVGENREPSPVMPEFKFRQKGEAEEIIEILRGNGIDVRVC